MSVGLVFWIVSEITEVLRSRAEEARTRRAARMAVAVADDVVGRATPVAPGLRARSAYLLIGSVLVSASVYLVVGSAGNYLRRGGYVRDISWLLALAVAVAAVALVVGVTALVLFLRYPSPPPWAWGLALRSPLASPVDDETAGGRPPWYLTAALIAATAALAVVAALVAWSPKIVESFNAAVTAWFAEHEPLGSIDLFDSYGIGLWFGAAALVVVVLAGLRCRVLLLSSLGAVAAAVLVGVSLRPLVAPAGTAGAHRRGGPADVPERRRGADGRGRRRLVLALVGLTRRPWIAWPLRIVGLVLVVASATHHLASGEIPTDVIGGLAARGGPAARCPLVARPRAMAPRLPVLPVGGGAADRPAVRGDTAPCGPPCRGAVGRSAQRRRGDDRLGVRVPPDPPPGGNPRLRAGRVHRAARPAGPHPGHVARCVARLAVGGGGCGPDGARRGGGRDLRGHRVPARRRSRADPGVDDPRGAHLAQLAAHDGGRARSSPSRSSRPC